MTVRSFPWGDQSPDCTLANFNNCEGDTSAVGSYPSGASPYGALDMAGNVDEWVNDSVAVVHKMLRGGDWDSSGISLRTASHDYYYPIMRYIRVGFRCVALPGR